jgi:hypothetical protein
MRKFVKTLGLLVLPVIIAGCAATPRPASSAGAGGVIGAELDSTVPIAAPVPAKPRTSAKIPSGIWSVAEVKDWYANYVRHEKGEDVGLMYQGSDATFHYFTARVPSTDSWISIVVARTDLRLTRDKPDCHAERPIHGYGFVNPLKDFSFVPQVGTP